MSETNVLKPKRGRPSKEKQPKEPMKRGRKPGTKLVDVTVHEQRYKSKRVLKTRLNELLDIEKKYNELLEQN